MQPRGPPSLLGSTGCRGAFLEPVEGVLAVHWPGRHDELRGCERRGGTDGRVQGQQQDT
jgi:hypothetical protein